MAGLSGNKAKSVFNKVEAEAELGKIKSVHVYILVLHTLSDALNTLHVTKMFSAMSGHTAAHSLAAMRPL